MVLQVSQNKSLLSDSSSYLTPTLAADLLGISRSTLYRYLEQGKINCMQFAGKTIIRKEDIDSLFSSHIYTKHENKKHNIHEYYSSDEVMEKYGISKTAIFSRWQKERFSRILIGGRVRARVEM